MKGGNKMRSPNHWVQATPVYTCWRFLSRVPGAPDPDRSAKGSE